MIGFDTVLVADWSAGKRRPKRPSADAIWLGVARDGVADDPVYCRTRQEAEAWIADLMDRETAAGRRLLATFDFPFGYPRGTARRITGSDDPFALWDWMAARITDAADGTNNRYAVAEEMNAHFDGPGPFWGKPNARDWPGVPYRKAGIRFEQVAEKRACDHIAKAASSCFQLAFPPTVGGQILMGIPTLHRLRARPGVAVWPFEPWRDAPVVLTEIWPGLIEPAVRAAMTQADADVDAIRDCEQVRLLSQALSRLPARDLTAMMLDVGEDAVEEAWILGAGHEARLVSLAGTAPALRNDCFALPPGVHWTPVDEALAALRRRLGAVVGVQSVAVGDALDRVLAAEVAAPRAHPPLPNTAVDGYGFLNGRGEGPHKMSVLAKDMAAGARPDVHVPAGTAVRILTGAALPPGVNTVILQEDVTVSGDTIRFVGPIKQGANTRKAGEDVEAGQVIAARGRRITPADQALLSAVGVDVVTVHARLRVGVLSTGDELVPAGTDAGPGQIYDANRPMLMGLVAKLGHDAVDLGHVADDRAALAAQLDRAAGKADVILTSGGASAGDHDHVSALLNAAGAMALWRIAIKPGRPLALGMWKGTPVFGLPGNPVAALVCTLVFAAPAFAKMAGAQWSAPQGYMVPAAFEKKKKAGRREFLRARIRGGKVKVFASEGSGRISGLAWADGLVELPDHAVQVNPGDLVRFIPWGGFGL